MAKTTGWRFQGELWIADLDCGHEAQLTAKELRAGVYHALPGETVPCPECDQEEADHAT